MGRLDCLTLFINISTNNYRPSFTHTLPHFGQSFIVSVSMSSAYTQRKNDNRINRPFVYLVVCCCLVFVSICHLIWRVHTHRGHAIHLTILLRIVIILWSKYATKHTAAHTECPLPNRQYSPCLCNELMTQVDFFRLSRRCDSLLLSSADFIVSPASHDKCLCRMATHCGEQLSRSIHLPFLKRRQTTDRFICRPSDGQRCLYLYIDCCAGHTHAHRPNQKLYGSIEMIYGIKLSAV